MRAGVALLCAVLLCLILLPLRGLAHDARPAYLEIRETGPNLYAVVWKVPMRGGMRLRIQPAFPAHCYLACEPEVEEFPSAMVERYELGCGPSGLDGETIEILGLRQTLVEVIVRVEMLDGRAYDGALKASATKYTIAPRDPGIRISGRFLLLGMRHTVRRLPVLLLVFALAWVAGLKRRLPFLLGLFALGYAGGFVGAAQGHIDIASEWGAIALAATALLLIIQSLERSDVFDTPIWGVWLVLAGIIFGAAFGADWVSEGIARMDLPVAALALFAGIWLGLLLLAGLAGAAGLVSCNLGLGRVVWASLIPFYVLGALSVFLLALALSGLTSIGVAQPYLRPESIVFALAAGLLVGRTGKAQAGVGVTLLIVMQSVGLLAGTNGSMFPLASMAIPLSLALLGIALVLRDRLPGLIVFVLVGVSGLYHGWINGNWLAEHVTIALPSAVGMCALFSSLLLFAALATSRLEPGRIRGAGMAGGVLLLAVAFAMRFSGYEATEFGEMTILASAGLRIPLASIAMILASVYFMVRGRGHGLIGGAQPGGRLTGPTIVSSLLLVAGLVLVPYGNLAIADYSGSAEELTQEGAADVIEGLLENTYRAVNLKVESEIYDRLALSVDGDLVEEIYLESRRRTVLPSESAAEARVIDVSVIDVADGSPAPGGRGYSFTCRWLVSGTVRHWAHKHNRLNRYAGRIAIRPVEDVWKISALELIDEERL